MALNKAFQAAMAKRELLNEDKYVKVADEDDDREDRRRDRDWSVVNPHHEKAYNRICGRELTPGTLTYRRTQRRVLYMGSWSPCITARYVNGEIQEVGYKEREAPEFSYNGTFGVFHAMLRCDNADERDKKVWRISCWGGDDTAHERWDMDEKTARAVWARLTHHITIRSLYNKLGFKGMR